VLAKQVFRGKCLGEEKRINSGYKPDWQLISKVGVLTYCLESWGVYILFRR